MQIVLVINFKSKQDLEKTQTFKFVPYLLIFIGRLGRGIMNYTILFNSINNTTRDNLINKK